MDRRFVLVASWLAALSLLSAIPFLSIGTALAQEEAAGEVKAFDADMGPAYIDVSGYPPEQQALYPLFAQKCSKCHTLARPINSSMTGDEWWGYVTRMSGKPGSGISPKTAEDVFTFLSYDSSVRARSANAVDPELLPFLEVSKELGGVARIPAATQNVDAGSDELRVRVEGDRRLNVKQLFLSDEVQKLTRWTQRDPSRAELQVGTAHLLPGTGPKDPLAPGTDAVSAASAEAIGTETDPEEKVELLLDWLDEKLERVPWPGDHDAAATIAAGRGDATEFTRAFCALAEAAGIPARSRVGLVAQRTAFHFHPWAEVWMDGWVPVDPYLGQLPADITHLRFVLDGEDGLSLWDLGRFPGLERLHLAVVVEDDGGSQ